MAVPLLIVITSGILLQVKKQLSWVQPPTKKGNAPNTLPAIDWNSLLKTAQQKPEAAIEQWSDINRLDIQVGKGIAKVISKSNWELQVDLQSGEILSSQYRRSDMIESLHDGSFFGEWAKLWLFLPNGIVLLLLWMSGLYLWYLPIQSRRRKRSRMTA